MAVDPEFVIGIGSQRAGTTLLHRVLHECSSVFMHPVKELHYFDTLYNVRDARVLVEFSRKQIEHAAVPPRNKREECFLRANKMLASKNVSDIDYLDLYRPCVLGHPQLGEITPEYMILPEEGVKYMAETIGAGSRIILITRDPVDRFISAFKLLKAYNTVDPDFSNFENEILDVFSGMPGWVEQQKLLNNYELSRNKFSKYFSNTLEISYEELTSSPGSTLRKVEELVGHTLDNKKIDKLFSKRVNEFSTTVGLKESARKLVEKELV